MYVRTGHGAAALPRPDAEGDWMRFGLTLGAISCLLSGIVCWGILMSTPGGPVHAAKLTGYRPAPGWLHHHWPSQTASGQTNSGPGR